MEPNADGSGNNSGRQSSTFAQRIGRQLSRGLLPALRSLVRSNRPQQQSHQPNSPRQRGRVAPEAEQSLTEMTDIPPLLENPIQPQQLPPPQQQPPESAHCVTNAQGENMDISPPPAESDSPPPLVDSPSTSGPLSVLNNLLDDDNSPQNEDSDANSTHPRQRYRLVVYFEERSPEEHTARYVAVIVGRLDELQFLLSSGTNEQGFGDILNHLFNAYAPKGTPPASSDSIDNLPTVTITDEHQSCMICLEKFAVGTTAVELPCKHKFHGEECVKTWLKLHNSCPICRYELPVEDAEYETSRKERMTARGFTESAEAAAAAGETSETAETAETAENSSTASEGSRWGDGERWEGERWEGEGEVEVAAGGGGGGGGGENWFEE